MPRKSFNDDNISRGKNLARIKDLLFPGESREQIGGKLGGVSEGTIRSWEKGKPIPNRVLVELERRGVSLIWLLASEGEMFKEAKAEKDDVVKQSAYLAKGREDSPPANADGVHDEKIAACLKSAAAISQHFNLVQEHLLRGELSADVFQKLAATLLESLESVLIARRKKLQHSGAEDHDVGA